MKNLVQVRKAEATPKVLAFNLRSAEHQGGQPLMAQLQFRRCEGDLTETGAGQLFVGLRRIFSIFLHGGASSSAQDAPRSASSAEAVAPRSLE